MQKIIRMYTVGDYVFRGSLFVRNKFFPKQKKLATLMLYATDLCNSQCKHCFVWKKRPVQHMPFETIKNIIQSKVVSKKTTIGLEGGEFLLHPEADLIMDFLDNNHPRYDLLSNCVQPNRTIDAVKKHKPMRLFVSLDGTPETHANMRGKDCYHQVIEVIDAVKDIIPVSVMFTLTPYNNFTDLVHVCEVCLEKGIDVRVGIYNNMPFFDTEDKAHSLQTVKESVPDIQSPDYLKNIPPIVKNFSENFDFMALYSLWREGKLKLQCNSITDSLIIFPNGDVPLCQNLSTPLGNVNEKPLHSIIRSSRTNKIHKHHRNNCNGCWINFHRKYDIILYRSAEKFGGRLFARMLFGKYHWNSDENVSYKKCMARFNTPSEV